ncbi:MAG: cation:proton antiporter [Sulfurifustis sp.]
MSNTEIGFLALLLGVFLALTHCLGYLAERLRQPRFVGEILAGVLLGPYAFGQLAPWLFSSIDTWTLSGTSKTTAALDFIYWVGLFFLMFVSGSETRRFMAPENRREMAWLVGIGTLIPFSVVLVGGLAALVPLDLIMGPAATPMSALLVLAIAVSVTSVPVIARIFYDLRILHTRFASLVLGCAVVEDIVLWAVLGVATAMATSRGADQGAIHEIAKHAASTLLYMMIGLAIAPALLAQLNNARWNVLLRASPIAYIVAILFAYIAVASFFGVNSVFAAFLAGFGIVGGFGGRERSRFTDSHDALSKVSFSIFIPLYFAFVGYKLVFGQAFSISMVVVFLVGSSLLVLFARGVAAYLAGFRGLNALNLAITTNARGGPGIVLATVAYDAGLINAGFYSALVITAVLTSQAAGTWLRAIMSRGVPILGSSVDARGYSTVD